MASAAAQSSTCGLVGSIAPPIHNTPVTAKITAMRTFSRRYGCGPSATDRITGRDTCATTYATANINPAWLNARGIATPITIPHTSAVRTTVWSGILYGSYLLVVHAVPCQTDQSASSNSSVLPPPVTAAQLCSRAGGPVRSSNVRAEIRVSAKTYARSKKSSRKVARPGAAAAGTGSRRPVARKPMISGLSRWSVPPRSRSTLRRVDSRKPAILPST